MPFAKERRAITIIAKDFGHQRDAAPDERTPGRNRSRAVAQRVLPGHQLPARRRTHRRDVKVAEAHALAAQLVQVGRFQRRIPMRRKIAVALIDSEYPASANAGLAHAEDAEEIAKAAPNGSSKSGKKGSKRSAKETVSAEDLIEDSEIPF